MVTRFPDPHYAPKDGPLALGGDLEPETLLTAYGQGIFPWPITSEEQEYPLTWFSPDPRAILEFDRLHLPRSLKTFLKKSPYTCTLDRDFEAVIRACASVPRPGQPGTWITPEMVEAYVTLHRLGHAHSVEVWQPTRGAPRLVGGLYGVDAGGLFAGESMFHREENASKVGLLFMIEHLRSRGSTWIDIQMLTPHLERLGARTIPRAEFLRRLAFERKSCQKEGRKLF